MDDGDVPQCKACGKYDLIWIPGGGHPQKSLRRSDNIMRSLAETYGLSNMKTARAGECVAPPQSQPIHSTAGTFNGMPINMDINGNVLPSCEPVKIENGTSLAMQGSPQPRAPRISQFTKIEARWSKDKGESAA